MKYFPRFAAVVLFLIICVTGLVAQSAVPTPESDAKQKEEAEKIIGLLDKAIADVNSLRLPQNRAVVYGLSGDLYWKFDQARAKQLFRNAASELELFGHESERERQESEDYNRVIIDRTGQQRTQVLSIVAQRDAELALELLLQTRSAKLAEALAKYVPRKVSAGPAYDPNNQIVVAEINLEQRFALLAADQNPELAIKLIKDSLAKGFSTNVLPLLEKLQKKDEKKAADLAVEVVKKIVEMDLMKSLEDFGAVSGMLTAVAKAPGLGDKKKVFTEAQLKEIALKVANSFLQPAVSFTMMMQLTSILPTLEKYVPDRAALLKQKQTQEIESLPFDLKAMQQRSKIWSPTTSPEDLLVEIPKLNEIEKLNVYSMLQYKIVEVEDEARAKKLISQIPDEKSRVQIQEAYDAAQIAVKAKAGKLDDARKMIGGLSKRKSKIAGLVKLAIDFHVTGKEKNVEVARELMKEARSLAPDVIETNDDLTDVMEVVRGYAVVEPDVAFKLSEAVIDQINEYTQAMAVLARFNPEYATFKKGEMVMRVGGGDFFDSPLFKFIPHMQLLGKADIDRMNLLTERFTRNDARTLARLCVLQGILAEEKKTAPAKSESTPL